MYRRVEPARLVALAAAFVCLSLSAAKADPAVTAVPCTTDPAADIPCTATPTSRTPTSSPTRLPARRAYVRSDIASYRPDFHRPNSRDRKHVGQELSARIVGGVIGVGAVDDQVAVRKSDRDRVVVAESQTSE